MRNLFPFILCLTLLACGDINRSKIYYKENNSARIEKLIWCDDNPAEASQGNCINAREAYRELHSDIKSQRSVSGQQLNDNFDQAVSILESQYNPQLLKLDTVSKVCREQQKENIIEANKACFTLKTAIERNACLKALSRQSQPSCRVEYDALNNQFHIAKEQERETWKVAIDELDKAINQKIETLK